MQYLVEFLLVVLGLASAYTSKFDGGNTIDRPQSQDASISNILKRSKRSVPDIVNSGSSYMNFRYGDSSVSNVHQNVDSFGSGAIRESYGDCSDTSITSSVKSYGSGDIHLVYGNREQRSNASTARVPRNANNYGEWPRNIISRGSGATDVTYGNCRSSSSRLRQNVNLRGSGGIRIQYGKSTTSEVEHDIYIAGSGSVYLEYDICNGGEESANRIVKVGSGRVYTICRTRRVLS